MNRSSDGYLLCAVRGCDEPARSWSYVLDVGDLEVEVMLCPRHDREMTAGPVLSALVKPEEATP
jgi:hypothetical protein